MSFGNNMPDEVGDLSLEAAIHKLSQEQALLMGLADRGLVTPRYCADLAAFDVKAISPGPFRTVNILRAIRNVFWRINPSACITF